MITGTGRRQRWTAETEARIIDYLALRENRRRSRREVRPDLWSAISSISILGAVLALLVVPALYSLWFAVRSDETLDAHIIQADSAEPFGRQMEPIRIAA